MHFYKADVVYSLLDVSRVYLTVSHWVIVLRDNYNDVVKTAIIGWIVYKEGIILIWIGNCYGLFVEFWMIGLMIDNSK